MHAKHARSRTRLVRHNKPACPSEWQPVHWPAMATSRDLSIVPCFSFGFVESYLQESSDASGSKNIGKAFKYFDEVYVQNLTGMCPHPENEG